MQIRAASAVVFLLLAISVCAQDLPTEVGARGAIVPQASDTGTFSLEEQSISTTSCSGGMLSKLNTRASPENPKSAARQDQWIKEGEEMPQFSDGLIMVARKADGRTMWHVEKVNSCVWCGAPMTWKQAMFDKKASSMWALRSALVVADVEIAHHVPCFRARTCKETNPILGQSRLQAYSVGAGLTALIWIYDGWARKGSRKDRIGGYTHWWIVPTVGYACSAVGIILSLATWHSR